MSRQEQIAAANALNLSRPVPRKLLRDVAERTAMQPLPSHDWSLSELHREAQELGNRADAELSEQVLAGLQQAADWECDAEPVRVPHVGLVVAATRMQHSPGGLLVVAGSGLLVILTVAGLLLALTCGALGIYP
jgi:hypothetical protein